MTIHKLKTLPEYFQKTIDGKKPFEVRLNDRDYKVGDTVVLQEWENGKYSGRAISGNIGYILNDFIGLKDGYIAFTLIRKQEEKESIIKELEKNYRQVEEIYDKFGRDYPKGMRDGIYCAIEIVKRCGKE